MIYDAPDWCRPYGITRPTNLPPDDAITDLNCWLTAQLDGLAVDTFELDGGGG